MTVKDQRGSVSILALFMLICFFAMGALVADAARHYCIKIIAGQKLNLAVRSAAAQLDEKELAGANIVIDENLAARAFYDVLKANLALNDALEPQTGSILNSPVDVEFFKVVKAEEVPYTYTYAGFTETLDRVAVVGIISFPVKSGWLTQLAGGPEETTMYGHTVAAPELIGRPAAEINKGGVL